MCGIKVSLIIPVYQAEPFLARCLDSIVQQDEKNWECILVDDGSTDGSGALCDAYCLRDSRFRVLHRPNGGASAARNSALALAEGEWVQFADSDDALAPDYCSAMLEASGGMDLVIAGYTMINGEAQAPFLPAEEKQLNTPEAFCECFDSLYFDMLLNSPCNKLYRRAILSARFPEHIHMGEDFMFNMEFLSKAERTALVRSAGYFYYQGNQCSATNNFFDNTPGQMLEYCHAALRVLARSADQARAKRAYDRLVFHSLCNNLNVASRTDGPLTPRIDAYLKEAEIRQAVAAADTSDFPKMKRLVQMLLRHDWKRAVAFGLRLREGSKWNH